MIRPLQWFAFSLMAGLALTCFVGCGGEEGPERYKLTGKVTFKAEPVPAGTILFVPAQGNEGPGATARIEDGQYETQPGKGHTGGKHMVSISGYDGVPIEIGGEGTVEDGTQVFSYEMTADLPKEDGATHDFDVPASAALESSQR